MARGGADQVEDQIIGNAYKKDSQLGGKENNPLT